GNAAQNPFFTGKPARAGKGILAGDGNYLVIDGGIEHVRNKARAYPLDLVRAWLPAREYRRIGRLHRNDVNGRVMGTERLSRAGNGAAGTDAGHESVD